MGDMGMVGRRVVVAMGGQGRRSLPKIRRFAPAATRGCPLAPGAGVDQGGRAGKKGGRRETALGLGIEGAGWRNSPAEAVSGVRS